MSQKIGPVRIKAIALRKADPTMTLKTIANECDVTKQRIFKIFKDAGVMKFLKPFPKCNNCGIILGSYGAKFCNQWCKTTKYFSSQPCATCGKIIKIRKYILRYKLKKGQYNFYCNRMCYNGRNINKKKIMRESQ